MSTARNKLSFTVDSGFIQKLLQWSNSFEHVCILDSNPEALPHENSTQKNRYDLIAAVDSIEEIIPEKTCFENLKKFIDAKRDWLFGFFSYDLKNEIEILNSESHDRIDMPLMHFFVPKYLFTLNNNYLEIHYHTHLSRDSDIKNLFAEIVNYQFPVSKLQYSIPKIESRISKQQYISSVNKLKKHIQQGDIYEVNFCQEFFSDNAHINPVVVFEKLNMISKAPYAAYYRLMDKYLMCASPERFIKKEGNKIISQPIKGTRKRGSTPEEDEKFKSELLTDEKERSENIMIVDIVRNDLSRTAKRGSVRVEELLGIYTFKQVHQLISTVSSEIKEGIHPVDVIKNAFPMGSMTGAPKIKAMQLIEKYESMKRGLFSGAIGYFTPNCDFDFNVVIRSILYNGTNHSLSFCAGGAITAKSVPENEYEETMVKAQAMFNVLNVS